MHFGVSLGNDRPGLAPPEVELSKEPLALAHPQLKAQRLRDMIEKTEPLRRAQYVQFYLAMRGRMQDRGIQTSGPRP